MQMDGENWAISQSDLFNDDFSVILTIMKP